MLTEIYKEALLVNEDLADQVWEAWDKGEIDDQVTATIWLWIADPYEGGEVNAMVIKFVSTSRNKD